MKKLQQIQIILMLTLTSNIMVGQSDYAYSNLYETEANYVWDNLYNVEHDQALTIDEEIEWSTELNDEVIQDHASNTLSLIEQFKLNTDIQIFPNPAVEDVRISYELFADERMSLRLYSFSGQLVETFFVDELKSAGKHNANLDISRHESGSYILVMNGHKQSIALKMEKY